MCSEWQPIETAPKDGRDILVYGEWAGETSGRFNGKVATTAFWNGGQSDYPGNGWWCVTVSDGYSSWIEASHWMPRPDPPVVDHPRPTTPVVDYEGGESDPQATRISELEAEVESWAAVANREDECRVMWQTRAESAEAEVERLKGELEKEWEWCADDAAIHSKYPIETEYERGYADGRREAAATIRQRARARSTAMNKGGEL